VRRICSCLWPLNIQELVVPTQVASPSSAITPDTSKHIQHRLLSGGTLTSTSVPAHLERTCACAEIHQESV
jgi:hypothetical protein